MVTSFVDRWDEKEEDREMYARSFRGGKAYTPDSSYKRYTAEQIHACNVIAMYILECNENGRFPKIRHVADRVFPDVDLLTFHESINILNENGFLRSYSLRNGTLMINRSKKPGLKRMIKLLRTMQGYELSENKTL